MIYFENASKGEEGLNTHVMSWTMCIALSNFLDRSFYFEFEIPSSTPPDYASKPEFEKKFGLLLESPRSVVSQLLEIPNRRVSEIDRDVDSKAEFQILYSHFATTENLRRRFEGTLIWDSFSVGRLCQTREQLAAVELIEWTHTKLANPSIFFFLGKEEKRALLDSVKIRYRGEIERLAEMIGDDLGPHHAVHLRYGDYFKNYAVDGYVIDRERFRSYARRTFGDGRLPILVSTDGLAEKDEIAGLFPDYQLIFTDELVFDEYLTQYRGLEFTDFNVLSIINQLLCASAVSFIGTYRSTFTSIIHRLRQERYGRADFDFFPDEKVAKLLNGEGKIVPDRSGFFDWNRYSVFANDHSSMSWMREWDHSLSAIDV